MDTAERVVKEKTIDTMVLDVEAENRIPKFRLSGEQRGAPLERRVCGAHLTSYPFDPCRRTHNRKGIGSRRILRRERNNQN
jgi:hypothetical protein